MNRKVYIFALKVYNTKLRIWLWVEKKLISAITG